MHPIYAKDSGIISCLYLYNRQVAECSSESQLKKQFSFFDKNNFLW